MLLVINVFAHAQTQPTSHVQWFSKTPDDCAEALAEKFEKMNLKLISINDIEVYDYDKQGKKTKTIKSTKRILELPENKVVQIEYDAKNVIKSIAISSTDIIDIAAFTNLFGTNTWANVIEEPEMVMKTTKGYLSKFYISTETRPSGLSTRSYSLFIEKEMYQDNPVSYTHLDVYKRQKQYITI